MIYFSESDINIFRFQPERDMKLQENAFPTNTVTSIQVLLDPLQPNLPNFLIKMICVHTSVAQIPSDPLSFYQHPATFNLQVINLSYFFIDILKKSAYFKNLYFTTSFIFIMKFKVWYLRLVQNLYRRDVLEIFDNMVCFLTNLISWKVGFKKC